MRLRHRSSNVGLEHNLSCLVLKKLCRKSSFKFCKTLFGRAGSGYLVEIEHSFPWDSRDPKHKEFLWNPEAFSEKSSDIFPAFATRFRRICVTAIIYGKLSLHCMLALLYVIDSWRFDELKNAHISRAGTESARNIELYYLFMLYCYCRPVHKSWNWKLINRNVPWISADRSTTDGRLCQFSVQEVFHQQVFH
ncbi:hypothetical protein LOAG_08974 [Loa loa]|uniref:Uncharacterized protein n=1 Tax=Loa loa TaxID=7209 RepID=A0A1S0TSZ3_LOALO|nr:hypothetical protein LOAG_08974 [Loa loa]EFO19515.1 hypothetical protein LOAG_08974 [Loa loa]